MRALLLVPLAALVLTACSPKPLTRMRAQVRDWPGGAGSVKVLGPQGQVLAQTSIDGVGRFTLPLPGEQIMTPLLRSDLFFAAAPGTPQGSICTGTVRLSNPAARFYEVDMLNASVPGRAVLALRSQSPSNRQGDPARLDQRALIYASAASRVQGELNCPLPGTALKSVTSYSLNLKAGWNQAVGHISAYASGERRRAAESVGGEGFEGWVVASGTP